MSNEATKGLVALPKPTLFTPLGGNCSPNPYCIVPLGPVVVFAPSALIAGHVPLTALAVEELLFPMY
jgi:hypothetical protein